jgi:hypothetical protein
MFNHGIVYTCDSQQLQQQSSVCRSAQSADEPNIEFIVQFGTSDLDNAEDVFADSSGVYVVGLTDGTFSGQTNEGGDDVFIRKYNSDGDEVWTRQFGTSGADFARGVSADSSGGVYVAGSTEGTFLGETSLGHIDAFLAKLVDDDSHKTEH